MRKRGLQLLRAVSLGLSTAVLIAWAIALAEPDGTFTCSGADFPEPTGIVFIEGPGYRIDALFRGLDSDPLSLVPRLGNYRGITFLGGVSWSGSMTAHSGFLLNGTGRTVATPTLKPVLPERVEVLAARSTGWPLHCLQSRATRTDQGWSGSWHILMTRNWPSSKTLFTATLPLRPLWPGLLANTLAFSSAWALVLSLPALARTVRAVLSRCPQGRCPNCGYDLRGLSGLICPECGRAATS